MKGYKYPNLEDFLGGQPPPEECSPCMAAARAARGKRKPAREVDTCYGPECGQRARETMARLDEHVRQY